MKLLLDTHTFLWLVEGSPNLSSAARTALADMTNDLFLIHTLDDGVRFRRAGLQDRSNFLAGNRTEPASVCMSVASVWELAIKTGNNKLSLRDPLDVFIAKWTAIYQLDLLPIQTHHPLALVGLPDHHKDPFDRILIAQAMVEGMTLVTGDSKFVLYRMPIIW